jgi:hypothetical protein
MHRHELLLEGSYLIIHVHVLDGHFVALISR